MPRAYWKGYLKLSLVSRPIELYPATTQAEKTTSISSTPRLGNRLRQKMVDEETGREVDKAGKGRGYEVSKGRYVPIGEDELKAVQIESNHTTLTGRQCSVGSNPTLRGHPDGYDFSCITWLESIA
jgi:DNA end-binding protein Ku